MDISQTNLMRELAYAEQSIEAGNYEQAKRILERSQLDVHSFCESKELGVLRWINGKLHEQQRNWFDAQTNYEESIALLETTSWTDKQVRSMISLAKCLGKTEGDDSALAVLYKAYEIAIYEKISLPVQVALVFELGITQGKLGELYSSIYFLKDAMKLNETMNSTFKSGLIQMSLGVCYMQLGQFKEAKGAFEKSIYAFHLSDDIENLAGTYMNLGILYSYFQMYEECYSSFKQSISLYQQLGENKFRMQCIIKLAQVYVQDGEFDLAISHCKSVVIEKDAPVTLLVKAYEILSDIAYQRHLLHESLEYVIQAISTCQLENSSEIKNKLITRKAKLLYLLGDFEQSASLIQQL